MQLQAPSSMVYQRLKKLIQAKNLLLKKARPSGMEGELLLRKKTKQQQQQKRQKLDYYMLRHRRRLSLAQTAAHVSLKMVESCTGPLQLQGKNFSIRVWHRSWIDQRNSFWTIGSGQGNSKKRPNSNLLIQMFITVSSVREIPRSRYSHATT